ncbi:NADP-dependent oxidoreductase [Sphingomonas sp. IC4-52]|uniref:NADP-dependent oxidoreductase n=1 Tax=Sphingomonas sp. IC4-52 TaxID=2887202 RepID=UPI001D102FF3|nr:NADP-dependent oxidoreductase [Sphingomonas sp. IC4-52]MCC2981325.1 NADP-dependent oxidoreductase [Sphingomonas sp. IC4-52]
MINRQWTLASHPTGELTRQNFSWSEQPLPAEPPAPGQILLQTELLLCAPTIRNWISGNRSSYYPTIEVGNPVLAPAVCRIAASDDPDFPVGARVLGTAGWQDYQWANPALGYRVIPDGVSSVDALGVLGMNALTAYFGMLDVARPRAGEVVLVSGAAGSVGSIAAQIGRIVGARVVAICGGAEKASWLRNNCRITDVIDYKSENVTARLDQLCPGGVDVFFDNVGGTLLRDVVARLNRGGRVALCGQIATYDGAAGDPPLDMMRIIYGAIRLQGFLVPDYADRYEEATTQLAQWLAAGELVHREDIRDGLEQLPETFASLFRGDNSGTLIARISDEEGHPL